jgi:hypothetical protein
MAVALPIEDFLVGCCARRVTNHFQQQIRARHNRLPRKLHSHLLVHGSYSPSVSIRTVDAEVTSYTAGLHLPEVLPRANIDSRGNMAGFSHHSIEEALSAIQLCRVVVESLLGFGTSRASKVLGRALQVALVIRKRFSFDSSSVVSEQFRVWKPCFQF